MIHTKTVKEVYERTWWFCECWCWRHFVMDWDYSKGFWPEIHHRFFKSQYHKDDRDESRNLALLYWPCHKWIHEWKNRELDERLKHEADIMKPKEQRSIRKVRKKAMVYWWNFRKYDKKIAQEIRNAWVNYFKNTHDWLTPSQYQYKQQKIYFSKKKNDKKNKQVFE